MMKTNLISKSNSSSNSSSVKESMINESSWTLVDPDIDFNNSSNSSSKSSNASIYKHHRSRNNSFCSSITDSSSHGIFYHSNTTSLLLDDIHNEEDDDTDDGNDNMLLSHYNTSLPVHNYKSDSISLSSSLRDDEYTFVEHIILPKDTLEGLCLKYKISATRLRQVNQFSGSTLLLAPKRLIIPIKNTKKGIIKVQDVSTKEYKLHKVLSECTTLGMKEIQAYLELHDWDVQKSILAAKTDFEWEKSKNDSVVEETKSPLEPPSTSYYRFINENNINVDVRITQNDKQRNDDHDHISDINAHNLLELKKVKDAAERWEELSHPNSYHSCIDNSMPLPMRPNTNNGYHEEANNIYFSQPTTEFGIEMKEMNTFISHPAVVTIPR